MTLFKPCLVAVLAVLGLGPSAWADPGADAWGAFIGGDHKKAFELARPAAEAGNMSAQALLGYLYWTGDQAPKDHGQAHEWFKKYGSQSKELAAKGDQSGEHGLGWLYENGWGGFKQDYAESAKWYRKAADQGNQHSQVQLGALYQKGLGVKQDYVEAASWFRKSADQGNRYAQFALGWFHQNGLGVKQDYPTAARFYRLAADVGEPSAEHALAVLNFYGLGVKQDHAEAARLWRKADGAGSAYAPWGLGNLCREGLGGFPKDHGLALKWFRTGVERGDLSYSGASLGLAYENGEGVVQDFIEAYKWFLLASARDNASGREGMNRLRQSMTKEQVADAQKQAAAFEASLNGKPAVAAAPVSVAAAPSPAKAIFSDVDAPAFQLKEDPRRFALVVGIDGYKDLPAAPHAERDADSVARTLVSMGYPERNVVELKGAEATIASLRKYLDEWLPRNARPGSTVFFYFSGHGAPDAGDGAGPCWPRERGPWS
ncbi:MAG: SEL1-like repeat protein [Elusimicrobia bacterium]|nr:SEL1-like repeat protein [Elusimicrobiota bacterium]